MQQSHTERPDVAVSSNDYYVLPATEKQILFAQQIANRSNIDLPDDVLIDRALSRSEVEQLQTKLPNNG